MDSQTTQIGRSESSDHLDSEERDDLELSADGGEEGQGVTIREAAQRLGMTEKMIRVRIRRGDLESWKVRGKFGEEWRVRLPEAYRGVEAGQTSDVSSAGIVSGESSGSGLLGSVPAALYYDLLKRHEEVTYRLGRLEAGAERSEPNLSSDEPNRGRIEELERAREEWETAAHREAEARAEAQAEIRNLQERLNSAEAALEQMRGLVKALGGG